MSSSIIIVDDDLDFLDIMKSKLRHIGFNNLQAEDNPRKVATALNKGLTYDLALIDMTMPEMDGMQLLDKIKSTSPTTECIMITAVNDARLAIDCLQKGAYDYLVKPVAEETLELAIKRALERKRLLDIIDIEKKTSLPKLIYADTFKPIVTQSRSMLRILKEAELHAQSDVPILITGDSGTGKELLAKAIHCASPRSQYRFTPVNMASVSAGLFESEFFGHTKGAFTGAANGRQGYLEYTKGGTLFLDEIGTLPPEMQGKLLRVLQDGEYVKVGANTHLQADVRFIAATNENLEQLMAQRMFRKDLFYRIRGGWLHLPPLKERPEDIPVLAHKFLQEYCRQHNGCSIADEALCLLKEYGYPGNVRELRSIMQSAANLAQNSVITADVLPQHLKQSNAVTECLPTPEMEPVLPLAQVEQDHILEVYAQTNHNKSQTARLLGIGLNTLRRKLKSYKAG